MNLQAITLRIADGRSAGVAGTFRPAAADLVLVVRRELTGEIEIVAVTGTTKLEIDLVLAAATRAIAGVATDPLSSPVLRSQRSCP